MLVAPVCTLGKLLCLRTDLQTEGWLAPQVTSQFRNVSAMMQNAESCVLVREESE